MNESLMVVLPVCRWRQELSRGQYLCKSAKYCFPPNRVDARFCADCAYADHDPSPPPPLSLPCVHLGGALRENGERRASADDGGSQQFSCTLHGTCRTAPPDQHQPTEVRSCETCADYLRADPFGPDSSEMRERAEES